VVVVLSSLEEKLSGILKMSFTLPPNLEMWDLMYYAEIGKIFLTYKIIHS
jgi:hypothetical protein